MSESAHCQIPDPMSGELPSLLHFPLRMRAKGIPRKVVFERRVDDEDVTKGQLENSIYPVPSNSVHVSRSKRSALITGSRTSDREARRKRLVLLLMAYDVPRTLSKHVSRTFLVTLPWKLRSDERLEGAIEGSDRRMDRSTRFARERVDGSSSALIMHWAATDKAMSEYLATLKALTI